MINVDWATIKTFIDSNAVNLQYFDLGNRYFIFVVNGQLTFACVIDKIGGSDQLDFELNYKTLANKLINSEALQYRASYSRITGNTTSTVKSGVGVLRGIIIGNNSSGGTVTVYDNTAGSGTVIMRLQCGTAAGGLLSSTGIPAPLLIGPLGIKFTTGLTVVTAGASSNDITMEYL